MQASEPGAGSGFTKGRGKNMASAEREPITGVCIGAKLPAGPGADRVRGAKPH